ncbi:MAG: sulfide/dihydroorotate dehydrogenase-like FAD/NAD-binding protein [Eubacteriales bacterium]|nr:sulfide/dihydroorotate dehydrogenase-like FAD/NAD-binding protein [Eubacteriales bacterium]
MYKVKKVEVIASDTYYMDIDAPKVARAFKPGHFVICKKDEVGERIPLTICDTNVEEGTVAIVFQAIGDSTKALAQLQEGDFMQDFVGPLGRPSELVYEDIEELKKKKILFVGGGVGVAPVYPQVKWMKERGIQVDAIIGARTKDLVILEDKMRAAAENLYVCTDDGSYGKKGLVTDMIKELVVEKGVHYDHVVAIGPVIMMKFVCLTTKELGLPTTVSMNPIMVDGTGMCGACRLSVGDEVKFACVDGPEFDGHLVNFDEAMKRQMIYRTAEGRKYLKAKEGDTHHGGCGVCGGDK